MLTKKKLTAFLKKNTMTDVQLLRLMSAVDRDSGLRSYIEKRIDWSSYTAEGMIDLMIEAACHQEPLICDHINLDGFSNEGLISLGKKAGSNKVWWRLAEALVFDGMTAHEMIKLGKSAGWSADPIRKRIARDIPPKLGEVPNRTLFRLSRIARDSDVANAIGRSIHLDGMSLEEVVELGRTAKVGWMYPSVWRPLTQKFLGEKPSVKDALAFGYAADSPQVWEEVLRIRKFSNQRLMEIGRAARSSEVWKAVALSKFSFRKASEEELFEIGSGADNSGTWSVVCSWLPLEGKSAHELVALANKLDHFAPRDLLRENLNLKGLSKTELIRLGCTAQDWTTWYPILNAL